MFITVRKDTLLRVFALGLLVLVVVGTVLFGVKAPTEEVPETPPAETESTLPPAAEGTVTVTYDDTMTGTLVLVNKETLLSKISEEGLVSVHTAKADTYRLKDNTLQLQQEIMEPLNRFLSDGASQGQVPSPVILSAYRDFAYQENLYHRELEQKGEEGKNWVAPPGGSEHHTGLCFDLATASGGKLTKISDHPTFSWLHQNCHKYGFVLRYDQNKTEITGFGFEPWHFRYVGVPHSVYMAENGLCLEEYMELLQTTSPSAPLTVTAEGKTYQIYRIPIGKEETASVPADANISGDNMGGVIVTLAK